MSNQMKEIDWSKAPEGTTHYLPMDSAHSACWIRRNADETLSAMYANGTDTRWGPAGHYLSKEKLLVPRPSAWTGEGLPPVGMACECQDESFQWQRGTIVYVGQGDGATVAVMQAENGILIGEKGEFRPIRTPEQIAEIERQKAIDVMVAESPLLDKGWSRLVCADLYDAGYRKVTP